jgi:hypothetical protein
LKRKSSIAESQQQAQHHPATKRKRSDTTTGGDEDPVRKYCLGKLEEVFKDVFTSYSYVRIKPDESGGEVKVEGGQEEEKEKETGQEQDQARIVMKKYEEMTDEEKETLVADSKQFAAGLEQCVFDIYAEPDKSGVPHAGAKYKCVSSFSSNLCFLTYDPTLGTDSECFNST